jgi:hypothetical protein
MYNTTKLTNYITSTTNDLMYILNARLCSKSPLFSVVGIIVERLYPTS